MNLIYLDDRGKIVKPIKKYYSCVDLLKVKNINFNKCERLNYPKVIILSDVNTRLLGNRGQAKIFGPQKGASKEEIGFIERSLSHWNSLLKKTYNKNFDKRFSGASGGIGAGISAILNGSLHSGSDYIMKKTGMERQIRFSKYVILGEGTIDNTTFLDKGILALAKEAKKERKSYLRCIWRH